MNDWAEVFDCPIYIHKKDEQHIVSKGSHLSLWTGDEMPLWDGMRLINIGGHFEAAAYRMFLFCRRKEVYFAAIPCFFPGKKHFSAVYSSPNRIPLPLSEIRRIKSRFDQISFDSFYGYIKTQNLDKDVKRILEESMARYI
jgi:hypothetical protein